MTPRRVPAVYMRGGTSKALVFREQDLPEDRAQWDAIFLSAMGMPDPNGRNLDGMGGGLSSLNKVCVVGPPSRQDADVDFTFVQLSAREATVDYSGNCGNMSSAIGPFALEEGLVAPPEGDEATLRIHNTNSQRIIVARFPVEDGLLAPDGDLAIDGVAGIAAPIRLEFLDPGGSQTGMLLPTGNAVDVLSIDLPPLPGGEGPGSGGAASQVRTTHTQPSPSRGRTFSIEASLVDAANPCVFVRARDVGKAGVELPEALETDRDWLARMAAIRKAGAAAMGLPDVPSIPKVAMVSPPNPPPPGEDYDIAMRMISVGQPHRAVPITGAICLGVACRIPGSLVFEACATRGGPIRIGHPSGVTQVDALVEDGDARFGAVYRTARRLFEGNVLWRD